MTKKILSYFLGGFIGILIIAPPIDYTIPLLINSFHWLYMICVAGLFGFFLLSQKLNVWLKILSVYLFASCFFSQAPALSFNAYCLVVFSLYLLLFFKLCDFNIVIRFIEAAFWFEVLLGIMQLIGKDVLLSFDNRQNVFMGTVMQYMRCASVMACMAPFLILKSRWYIIPLAILCVISQSSTLALSLIAGGVTFGLLLLKKQRGMILIAGIILVALYAMYDWGSWQGAIVPSNGGRLISWAAVVKTWIFDLSKAHPSSIWNMNGPFNLQWFLIGHGMDTFLPLFPVYKHDINPFPQAHNDWLQMMWEIGILGFCIILKYFSTVRIICEKKQYLRMRYLKIAGLVILSVNIFFAFPMRMTQTMFLMIAYLALCEQETIWTQTKI